MNGKARAAAEHWEQLATEEEARAVYEARFGSVSSFHFRARTYRQTAEALRREADTGTPHCSQCGGAHPNHRHPYVNGSAGCKCAQSGCPWCVGTR